MDLAKVIIQFIFHAEEAFRVNIAEIAHKVKAVNGMIWFDSLWYLLTIWEIKMIGCKVQMEETFIFRKEIVELVNYLGIGAA